VRQYDRYLLQHCALCQDGGRLWVCQEDDCERAICSECIDIPDEELDKLEESSVRFTCVPCHWRTCRDESRVYYVSVFCLYLFVSVLKCVAGFH
jgi:hypothetical protein